MSFPILGILYDEGGDPMATYEGVTMSVRNPDSNPDDPETWFNKVLFFTGSPNVDYATALLVVGKQFGNNTPCMGSSSVDHFVMDNLSQDEYDSAVKAAKAHLGMPA